MQKTSFSDFAVRSFLSVSGKGNVAYSPYSTAKALELLRHGIRGESLERLAAILDPEVLTRPNLKHAQLAVEQSLWWDPSIVVKDSFKASLRAMPGSHLAPVPFRKNSDEAARAVNAWAHQATKGLVSNLVNPAEVRELLTMLASALYVKATWNANNKPLSTKRARFHTLGGAEKRIGFLLSREADHSYYQGDGVQIVELPLGRGDIHLGLVLPDEGKAFLDWKKSLTGARLRAWIAGLALRKSFAVFPAMDVKTTFDLNGVLTAEGLGGLFRENPDFAPISDAPLKLNSVKQKTAFTVNETGIEAAAVTYEEMAGALFEPQKVVPVKIVADRPFVFYLATKGNAELLFVGQFVE